MASSSVVVLFYLLSGSSALHARHVLSLYSHLLLVTIVTMDSLDYSLLQLLEEEGLVRRPGSIAGDAGE